MVDKHIFILNPAAGISDTTKKLAEEIKRVCIKRGLNFVIKVTEYSNHATVLVQDEIERTPGRICRFYACGGDGTLNEVMAGAVGAENVQVACYPCGTANDFIKMFDGREHFSSFDDLIDGEPQNFDLMQLNGKYALNLCSVGLDARVADWVGKNKRNCPFSGGFPYKLSIIVNFFKEINRSYKICVDGCSLDGEYVIMVVSSGRYYGGGFYAVPDAQPDDGMLDLLFIKKVSRLTLVTAIGKYESGKYKEIGDKVIRMRGKTVKFTSKKPEPVNFDGEILQLEEFSISISERKLPFVIPKNAALINSIYENKRETAKI